MEVLLCERVNDLRHSLFHLLNCLITTACELREYASHKEQEMPLKGICWLPVEIGGMSTWSKFYIAPNSDRAMILGENWLKKDQAQIRFKSNLLTIKGVKIPRVEVPVEQLQFI